MYEYFNFEKAVLERLESAKERYEVADTKVAGLRLRINNGGRKTYFLLRRIKQKAIRLNIGRFEDLTLEQARKEATRLNSLITLGTDPYEQRKAARIEMTFQELWDLYYTEYASKFTKRSDDNKKMIEFHILPKIGKLQLREIKSDKIRGLHLDIGSNRGKSIANRVMHIVNAVFNFGIKDGHHIMVNPCFGIKKFKEYSRDRFLNQDELKGFFGALTFEIELFRDYFLTLLFTGARKSNVLAMRWRDIDLSLGQWRIPGEETKNSDINTSYLSKPVIEILQRRHEHNLKADIPSPYVFPGEGENGYLNDPKRAFQRIRDRMKLQDIRIHDLRRTLGSYMAISGASLPIIGKALNHKHQNSTMIYARLNQNAVAEAVNNAANLMSL